MAVELVWESQETLQVIYTGEVTGQQAVDSLLAIGSDPRFDQLRFILGNGATITKNIASDTDIEKMTSVAKALSKTNPGIKNAVVMGSNEAAQALVNFYQFLAEDIEWQVDTFTTEADARAWLASFT
ncbi:hypothetical protein [Oceanicoccus sagamiensis]|nr:hypothetical protein [Oceanicoccus sagamiensis]